MSADLTIRGPLTHYFGFKKSVNRFGQDMYTRRIFLGHIQQADIPPEGINPPHVIAANNTFVTDMWLDGIHKAMLARCPDGGGAGRHFWLAQWGGCGFLDSMKEIDDETCPGCDLRPENGQIVPFRRKE